MSFIEDPTRIFRAVRFEKRLGFRMDRHTEELARSAVRMDIVSRLTGVRIRDELIYIMDEERPFNAIRRLYDLGALSKIGISRDIEKGFVGEMRKALDSSAGISSYDGVEIMKWRMLLAMMLEGKTSRSIESWCLKMKIKKRDMVYNKKYGSQHSRRKERAWSDTCR